MLTKDGAEVGRTITDLFGEFKIDRLQPRSGEYHLEATGASGSCSADFELADDSPYLGVMTMAKT